LSIHILLTIYTLLDFSKMPIGNKKLHNRLLQTISLDNTQNNVFISLQNNNQILLYFLFAMHMYNFY